MSKRVNIRIRYRCHIELMGLGILLILIPMGIIFLFGFKGSAFANDSSLSIFPESEIKEFYLSKETKNGVNAVLACAQGYHMASLWEILDPSGLKYNTVLGHTKDDSGFGPPVDRGWVRTGYVSYNEDVAGRANCNSWSTTSGYGTIAIFPNDWEADWEDLLAWNVYTWQCNSTTARVWCVEDDSVLSIFLPLVVKNSQ